MRKIIHVDMDAFFAAVEQLDHPEWRGKPVIVGGAPTGRGVVSTASYEARRFGIHSAMPTARAGRLCPQGVFVSPRFHRYKEISQQVMEIFRSYTESVEAMSLDEAYLDVTENKKQIPFATEVAKEIRKEIFEKTGLTASAGVASSKFIAKIASDLNKPDGLTVIPPHRVKALLKNLPIRKVPGIGKVTEANLVKKGILTVGDLQEKTLEELEKLFGKRAHWYFDISRGIDPRRVSPRTGRKSIGAERTFSEDSVDLTWLEYKLEEISQAVSDRLKKNDEQARTVTLKLTFFDFTKKTKSRTLPQPVRQTAEILEVASSLLKETDAGEKAIRLLGLSLSGLDQQALAGRRDYFIGEQLEFDF